MDAATLKSPQNPVAEAAEEMVDDQPWLEPVTRLGWLAKGAVYALMGLTAFTIGRHEPTPDHASPEGAIAQVVTSPGGTLLLAALALGLILYSAWRVLSVALIRGHGLHEWGDRAGYTFSAAFYTVLAITAITAVVHGDEPQDTNTVERLSRSMLESSVGRWVLLAGGMVACAVGGYFVVEKGLKRSFRKDLEFSNTSQLERQATLLTGAVGWVSRGLITTAIGWFLLHAAWDADSSDARGFDRAFRALADDRIGALAVSVAGIGLVVYGVFCVLSVRHLDLER